MLQYSTMSTNVCLMHYTNGIIYYIIPILIWRMNFK